MAFFPFLSFLPTPQALFDLLYHIHGSSLLPLFAFIYLLVTASLHNETKLLNPERVLDCKDDTIVNFTFEIKPNQIL